MRIPQYQLQVEPRAAPNVAAREEAPALAFGAGEAQGLQKIGAALGKTGDVFGEHAVKFATIQNETNVNDVFANQFAPEQRKLRNEYSTLEGKRAVDGYGPAEQKMQKLRESISATLPNPVQQQMFDKLSRAQIDQDLTAMSTYAAAQNKAWKKQTHLSMLKNFADDASDNFGDPRRIGLALKSGMVEIEAFGAENGQDEETIKQAKRNFSSVLHGQVIQRLALRSPGAAQAYYDKVKGEIEGETKVTLERTIRREAEHQAQLARASQSIDRQNATQSAQDYQAGLESGAIKPNEAPPKELTRENLTKLYPRDPVRVERMLTTVEAWRRKAALKDQIMQAPADQIPGLLTKTPTAEPGTPGYKAESMAQRQLITDAEKILASREKIFKDVLKAEMAVTLGIFDRPGEQDLPLLDMRLAKVQQTMEFLVGKDKAAEAVSRIAAVETLGRELQAIRQGDVGQARLKQAELLDHVEKIIDGIPDDDGKFRGYVQGYIQKVIAERNQGLAAAPAEYAIKYNPAVQQALDAYQKAPPDQRAAAAQAYALAMQSALQQYGVAADKKYRLLPESMVASITDKLVNAPPDQNMAVYVNQLSREFGPYWPKVASQLGTKRPELMLMAEASPTSAVAQDLLKIMPLKLEELKKSAPDLSDDALRKNINKQLQPLRESLPGLQADPSYDGLRSGIEKLSVYYVGQGMSVEDAVKKAASPITQNYEFRTINGGTVRMPKSAGDPATLERGIRSFMANLYRVDLEPDWKVYYPGMTEDAARTFKLQAARSRAVAVTVGDEIQLFMKDPNGASAMTPLRNFGVPITVKFSELQNMGTSLPEGRQQERTYHVTPGGAVIPHRGRPLRPPVTDR